MPPSSCSARDRAPSTRVFERRAPDASPASDLAGRRVRLGRAHPGILKPDATMIGVDRHGNRTAVMFGFVRTRRPSKQAERLQRYDWFLTVGLAGEPICVPRYRAGGASGL
jgi:hypothetical protein